MAKTLTPRGKALHWLSTHRGITEQPPGSNKDRRKDGIMAAQRRLGAWLVGTSWCGTWACIAALAGGVKMSKPYRWASVAFIEEDAKAKRNGFRGWVYKEELKTAFTHRIPLRADLVVLFGPGVHVETIRSTAWIYRKLGRIVTDGGNTSSGNKGSQANGGGAFRRVRRIKDIYGIALVDYPG
jgi:hypothetical protein